MMKTLRNIAVFAFWLLIWQIVACMVNNRILLAGPVDTLVALAQGVVTPAFWAAVGFSFIRILAGFTIAFTLALAFGTLSWRVAWVRTLLQPFVTFMKSVPVVCIIVLLLVWMGSANVSVVAVALMVFPPVFFAQLEGLMQTSEEMRQMLDVFAVSTLHRIRYYYIPAVMPYITSAARVVVGIAWKSGIAAEVIGIPADSVGAEIYAAKIGLESADLFAWTFAIVGLSALSEKAFLKSLDLITAMSEREPNGTQMRVVCGEDHDLDLHTDGCSCGLVFDNVGFSHDGKPVIRSFSQTFEPASRYCIMGPTGTGKTTLLNLACGLEKPDSGIVIKPDRVSCDFQEDRLLPWLSAWGNVSIVCNDMSELGRAFAKHDLDDLLGRDSAALSIRECSGGMKRKIALMRALSASGDVLLLDEPFSGMDDSSRAEAIDLVKRLQRDRTIIVATHNADDLRLLDAELVHLSEFNSKAKNTNLSIEAIIRFSPDLNA